MQFESYHLPAASGSLAMKLFFHYSWSYFFKKILLPSSSSTHGKLSVAWFTNTLYICCKGRKMKLFPQFVVPLISRFLFQSLPFSRRVWVSLQKSFWSILFWSSVCFAHVSDISGLSEEGQFSKVSGVYSTWKMIVSPKLSEQFLFIFAYCLALIMSNHFPTPFNLWEI